MRNSSKFAVKPLIDVYSDATDTLVHIPCHGGGAAAGSFSGTHAITRGYPTKLKLTSTPSPLPMPGSTIKVSGVTPAAYDGYHKVIDAVANEIWIDLDSSAMADWVSGGSANYNVLYDRFGNMAPQDVSGTITGLWANPMDGLTSHSAGSYTPVLSAADAAPFDLTGFRGILVIGLRLITPANANAEEFVFSVGRSGSTGAYSGSGSVNISIASGTVQLSCYFRPRTVAGADAGGAGGGTAVQVYTGGTGNSAKRRIAFLLDLRDTAGGNMYSYVDGVLKQAASINVTNLIDWPGVTNGAVIGANLNNSLAAANLLGAAATPSQARVSDLWWWKSSKSMVQVQRAILKWSQLGELPTEVV